MTDSIEDIRQAIEVRLAEIGAEAKALEEALKSMKKGGGRKRPGRPKGSRNSPAKTPSGGKRTGGKRAPRGQRRQELLAAIEATPGARPVDLANAIGIKPAQVHALIAKVRGEKLVVKSGKGYALKS